MSYFEKSKLTDSLGTPINPVTEESLTLLRRIFQLLKPLGMVSGAGSNRLSVDINSAQNATLGTVGTVNVINTVNSLAGITTFDLLKAMSRTAYNGGIRSNIN